MLQKLFVKVFRNAWKQSNTIQEATPYVFEYDRAVPGFEEFTQNLIKHRYDTKRCISTNELTPQTPKRGRGVKGRN